MALGSDAKLASSILVISVTVRGISSPIVQPGHNKLFDTTFSPQRPSDTESLHKTSFQKLLGLGNDCSQDLSARHYLAKVP